MDRCPRVSARLLLVFALYCGTSSVSAGAAGGNTTFFRLDGPPTGLRSLCAGPEIFSGRSGGLQHGIWSFSSNNITDQSCERSFDAADPKQPSCKLHHFTHEQAMQCLAGKHIVMVGDSLTRYQFESLTTFLEAGDWPDQVYPTSPLHPVNAHMAEKCGCGAANGRIRCDRFRDQQKLRTTLVDNRYYSHRTANLNVSLFGYYNAARGHAPMGFFPTDVKLAKKYQELNKSINTTRGDWEGDLTAWAKAAKAQLAAQKFPPVDVLVVNSGLWANPEFSDNVELAVEQLKSLRGILKKGRGSPIWLGSTLPRAANFKDLNKFRVDAGYYAAKQLGMRILDRTGMTQALGYYRDQHGLAPVDMWVDRVHFRPFVSREFNNVLLNMLCAVQ